MCEYVQHYSSIKGFSENLLNLLDPVEVASIMEWYKREYHNEKDITPSTIHNFVNVMSVIKMDLLDEFVDIGLCCNHGECNIMTIDMVFHICENKLIIVLYKDNFNTCLEYKFVFTDIVIGNMINTVRLFISFVKNGRVPHNIPVIGDVKFTYRPFRRN